MTKPVQIGVVDDHRLFRIGLINLIHSLDSNYKVILEAHNGKELIELLANQTPPDLLLLDANMPIMDGYKTAAYLQKNHPSIRVLIITMNTDEDSLIRMLRLGVKGYIGKDVEPNELKLALTELTDKGFYYTDEITSQLINALQNPNKNKKNTLSNQELKFIKLACSEHTYVQIADIMCLSPKTIDGYRAAVFDKLGLKSRVGLAIYAIKTGLVVV